MEDEHDSPSLEAELERFPASVVSEYHKAEREAKRWLKPEDLDAWAREGIAIAQHSFRSWEAATEYFRATPEVAARMAFPQLLSWARWGRSLSADSPVVSSSFFRASPQVLNYIEPESIGRWATYGKGLYKGTWKSSSLASTYFESSPRLLQFLNLNELEELIGFIDTLAEKSYDLANECLANADGVFSKVEPPDRRSFLSLASVLARSNWRDIKPFFENGSRSLVYLEKSQRSRFLSLAERLAKDGGGNAIGFLLDASAALGEIDQSRHVQMLGMAERLADVCPPAVGEFLRNAPQVLVRVKDQYLELWFEEGVKILRENEDGGLAFFRLESGRGERVLESLTNGVQLDRIKEIMTMYCRALSGRPVELLPTQDLKERGIGWNSSEQPTTEGNNIYLPAFVERYGSKELNFGWFKVIATHQVAHMEFGSFEFQFERPSSLFADQDQRMVIAGASSNGAHDPVTDVQRFFDLFPDRQLAADIFTLVEDGRIDHRVKWEYPGLRKAYEAVQREAVAQRQEPNTLPLRESLMEVLVRLSLEDPAALTVHAELREHIEAVASLAKAVQRFDATVEDTAEVTVRIYDIVSQTPNMEAIPEESEERTTDEMGQSPDMEALQQLMQELQAGGKGQGDAPPKGRVEEEYNRPQQVEFRGDFKPELVQALENLKQDASKSESDMRQTGISPEDLKQMLQNSAEIEISEVEQGEIDRSMGMFVDNLINEAAKQQAKTQQGGQFAHSSDDDQPLVNQEPETFLYDEWDFRAADYKPRWCCVREKRMEEGTQDFFDKTLKDHSILVGKLKRQFEMLAPEMLRKVKHLPDGDEYDFDLVVESVIQRMAGDTPTDKVYWRRNKIQRDVAVAFLLDMSASTAEAVDEARRQFDTWDFPDDPRDYMAWLKTRREEMSRRTYKRIIDIEKESTILFIKALEAIGDSYGIFGFSGYGRENVEFYVIKDMDEKFGDHIKRRIDKITPMHATRMGPAIRHAITKLDRQEARTKVLFLLSDGRPQDRGYSREGVEKEYAVHDTRMALNEARRKKIVPFCLTVDRSGHDYLKTMCSDMGYEVVTDIHSLPERLPALYRRLTL